MTKIVLTEHTYIFYCEGQVMRSTIGFFVGLVAVWVILFVFLLVIDFLEKRKLRKQVKAVSKTLDKFKDNKTSKVRKGG